MADVSDQTGLKLDRIIELLEAIVVELQGLRIADMGPLLYNELTSISSSVNAIEASVIEIADAANANAED